MQLHRQNSAMNWRRVIRSPRRRGRAASEARRAKSLRRLEIDDQLGPDRLHKQASDLACIVVGHVGSEITTKISIAGVAVANQSVSCRSSLARQRPEILRRAA